jgi:hypothetical protein
MENIKKCFSKKVIIGSVLAATIVLGGGAAIGSKYLNKSQSEFKTLKKELSKRETNLANVFNEKEKLEKEIISLNTKIKDLSSWKDKKSFILINRSLLETNLKLYTKLSPKIQKIIIDNVIETANKYNINPLIVYSLLHVESTMRFQIEHSKVLINIKGKKKYIRAVGLGGIVWEWWGDALKKEGIAQTRSDLFLPDVNIKAVGFVLNEMYKKPMLKGCKSKDESMLRRFFGGNFKNYSDKIDLKVMSIVKPNLYRY